MSFKLQPIIYENRKSSKSSYFFENELKNEESSETFDNEINYRLDRRGKVIIFNYVEFKESSRRFGSDIDVNSLQNMFQYLQFHDINVYKNLTFLETESILTTESSRNHSKEDCLIIVILSHGDSDGFHCQDKIYPYDALFSKFYGDRCPTLLSKPKLFFFQCCRGERFDNGSSLVLDNASSTQNIRLPATSDLFAFYATFKDYYAWRNPTTGSWFIQEMVKIFNQHSQNYDLLTLATLTCRQIAFNKESNVVDDPLKNKKKQMPTIMSTLTKRLFFFEAKH